MSIFSSQADLPDADRLMVRLKSRESIIGVIGLGYVGLPLVQRFSAAGFKVIGIDVDAKKVNQLNDGRSYIEHISNEKILEAKQRGFRATTDFSFVSQCDAVIICVPTPLNKYREPELGFVVGTMESIRPFLRAGQVVALESTSYPGTTEEEVVPRCESDDLTVGDNIFVVYSPEREDPGNTKFSTQSIPKICGGHTKTCLQVGVSLYEQAIDRVVAVSSTKAAEMTKLLENIHRAVNIGLVNEMKMVADKMDIDIHEVIAAAATKPFGFTPYYPGPGLGGHCIPVDPFYLTWKAREYGLHTRFIELSGEINQAMPAWVVGKIMDSLNDSGLALKHSKILLLGISYKKNVDDVRESPAIQILDILLSKGAKVSYSDPHVDHFPRMRKYYFDMSSIELSQTVIEQFDAVVLTTDHDRFDYDLILKHAKLVIDTRGKYLQTEPNVVKA